MSDFVNAGTWLFQSAQSLFSSMLKDWGIIGIGIIATFLLVRVSNFMHRFFR